MDRWERFKHIVRRVARFVGVAGVSGVKALVHPLREGLSLLALFFSVSVAGGVAAVLGAGVLLSIAVALIVLLLVLLTGAFREWDTLEQERSLRQSAQATLEYHIKGAAGAGPAEHHFTLNLRGPQRTINLDDHSGAAARAVRFLKPKDVTVRPSDLPAPVEWGPFWARRKFVVVGFSTMELVIEHGEPIPGDVVMQVYYE